MSVKSSILGKKPKDIYEQLRPHSGIRYSLSQTDINFDAGITKVHLTHTQVDYEPGQDLTTPPLIEPVAKKYGKQRGRGPIWVFQEEIDAAKYEAKKGPQAKDIVKRLKAREREEARGRIAVHKELVKRIGPDWYQELSNKQMASADELKVALLADYKEGTIWRIQDVFCGIGLVLWPNHTKIEYSLKKFYKCPVEFLLSIYSLTTTSDGKSRDSYSLNDRLILSSVVHLTIRDTLRELHIRIPSPPREPREKPKHEKRGKAKKKPVSPYMEPFFFAEQRLCEGIYKDTHKQCPISTYFDYVDDMYDTWWELQDTICTHKLRESKYARPPKIPVKNIASKMVRTKRYRLKKPALYQMACGLVKERGQKGKDSIRLADIPNDGKCHCDLRMSASLLEYIKDLAIHLAKIQFPCGCLRDMSLFRDPCYMASNVCPCARVAQQNREFEGCTCCPDGNNPAGCQCCCNSGDIVQNVSNTVDAIQRMLDANLNQPRTNINTTKEIEDMLSTNIDAIRERSKTTSKTGNLQKNRNAIKTKQGQQMASYPCPFNCGGGNQMEEIKEEIEVKPVDFIDEEVKPVQQQQDTYLCCCKKKPKEEPKPWMAENFNWDDPYSLCTCVQTTKPGPPDQQFVDRLVKYNEENKTEYFPCSCHGSPEEDQYKICQCIREIDEFKEETVDDEGFTDTINDIHSRQSPETLDIELLKFKKSRFLENNITPGASEIEITGNPSKDCICFKMYEDYMNIHEECLELFRQYQEKIKTATEDHIDEIQEARCTCGSNPTSSDSTPQVISEESCTCTVAEDLINYCRECMGSDEDMPIEEEVQSNVCECTREKLYMCTCEKSHISEEDPMKEEKEKKKKKRKNYSDNHDEMDKKIFRMDELPMDQWDQMDLLQDVLIELAKDGYPLAKLPDCHLLPHFRLWLRKRTKKCVTQEQRRALAEKSKIFWNHTTLCRRKLIMATLGLSKKVINELTWGEIFKHRRLIETTKTRHYRNVKQAYIDETQEFFASTYDYDLPMKSFRDCFFAYLPSDENHSYVIRPWQPHEYRQMVGKSCTS